MSAAQGEADVPRAPAAAVDPQILATADRLRRAVAGLQRQLRGLRAEHGVSPSKLVLLGRLHRAGSPMTAVALAKLERLQPQSLTRSIAELHERGLVTRRTSEKDRRQILIEITAAGRDLLVQDARAQTLWLAHTLDTTLSGMEQGLIALAVDLLKRMVEQE